MLRLYLAVFLVIITGCVGYVQETTNSPFLLELGRTIKAIEATAADGSLSYEEKDARLKSLYFKGLSRLESPFGSAAFNIETDYKAFVEPLFDNLIAFYAGANRPHDGKFVVDDAMRVMRSEYRFNDYFKYADVLLDLVIGAGRTERCHKVVGEVADFYDSNFSWMDIESHSPNQDLDIKLLLLTMRDMRLRCDIADQQYADVKMSLYREYWQDMQHLYEANDLLPLKFLAQDSFKFIYNEYDRRYLPKNTRYLESLFDYFYEVRDTDNARAVANMLLEWYGRTTALSESDATAQFVYKWGVTSFVSESADKRGGLRFGRFKKRYQLKSAIVPLKLAVLSGDRQDFLPLIKNVESVWLEVSEYYRDLDPIVAQADNVGLLHFEILMLRGQVFEELGDFGKAVASYESAVSVAEQWRSSIPLEERKEFFRSFAKNAYLGAYRAQAELAIRQPDDDASFMRLIVAGERLRSRQLREMLESDDGVEAPTNDALTAEHYRSLGQNGSYYMVSDLGAKMLTLSVDNDARHLSLINKPPSWEGRIETIRRSIVNASQVDYGALASVSNDLFAGHADFLRRNESLQIVVDGRLSRLPFSLFVFDGAPLGVRKSIRYMPSLSGHQRRVAESADRLDSLFAIADPEFSMDQSVESFDEFAASSRGRQRSAGAYFEPLPETRDEVEAIIQLIGSDSVALYGANATESKLFEADLRPVKVLHFATHGVLGGEIPGLSEPALVLTPENGGDGLLTASEIQNLRLDAELVVLSACNTGSGEYYFGESVAGLGRAFALAGAKNIIVSLWPVDSLATERLMVELYSRLVGGMNLADALKESSNVIYSDKTLPGGGSRGLKRVSEGGVSAEGSHPYYWAPFIVMSL